MNSIHPHPDFAALGTVPHQPVVMGVAAGVLGLGARDAALSILHENSSGAAAAKVMRVDPFEVHPILACMTGQPDRLADRAAEHHGKNDVRLFAS